MAKFSSTQHPPFHHKEINEIGHIEIIFKR